MENVHWVSFETNYNMYIASVTAVLREFAYWEKREHRVYKDEWKYDMAKNLLFFFLLFSFFFFCLDENGSVNFVAKTCGTMYAKLIQLLGASTTVDFVWSMGIKLQSVKVAWTRPRAKTRRELNSFKDTKRIALACFSFQPSATILY